MYPSAQARRVLTALLVLFADNTPSGSEHNTSVGCVLTQGYAVTFYKKYQKEMCDPPWVPPKAGTKDF